MIDRGQWQPPVHGRGAIESRGGDVIKDDGSRLVGENYCTKTTNERVLEFLKLKAEICELDDEGTCKIL